LSMISAQTLCVCREGKPLHAFPDHALAVREATDKIQKRPNKFLARSSCRESFLCGGSVKAIILLFAPLSCEARLPIFH
jgi:hypothetical protein